jgi:hypothetical protein
MFLDPDFVIIICVGRGIGGRIIIGTGSVGQGVRVTIIVIVVIVSPGRLLLIRRWLLLIRLCLTCRWLSVTIRILWFIVVAWICLYYYWGIGGIGRIWVAIIRVSISIRVTPSAIVS